MSGIPEDGELSRVKAWTPGDESIAEESVILGWANAARRVRIERCVVRGACLGEGDLTGMQVRESSLVSCDLGSARLVDTVFRDAELRECRMSGADWSGTSMRDVAVRDCRIELGTWFGAALERVRFERCVLHGADFDSSRLAQVAFCDCDLTEARFPGVRLRGVDVRGSTLDGVMMEHVEGLIVSTVQAPLIARIMGADVRDEQ